MNTMKAGSDNTVNDFPHTEGVCAVPLCGEDVLFFSSVFHSSQSLAACGADFMKERMTMALCAPCYLEVYQHLTVSDAQLYKKYLGDCPALL